MDPSVCWSAGSLGHAAGLGQALSLPRGVLVCQGVGGDAWAWCPLPFPQLRSCRNKGTAWGGGGHRHAGFAARYCARVAIRAAAFNLFPSLKRLQGGWQMLYSPSRPPVQEQGPVLGCRDHPQSWHRSR